MTFCLWLIVDVQTWIMAYGACWEPAMAQYNLSVDLINKPSVDPSRPVAWWDKIRLLLHGRLTMSVQQMSWLYHASFDPYNTTELMDWSWTDLILDWTNGENSKLSIFIVWYYMLICIFLVHSSTKFYILHLMLYSSKNNTKTTNYHWEWTGRKLLTCSRHYFHRSSSFSRWLGKHLTLFNIQIIVQGLLKCEVHCQSVWFLS